VHGPVNVGGLEYEEIIVVDARSALDLLATVAASQRGRRPAVAGETRRR
jgi:hypothetical protein